MNILIVGNGFDLSHYLPTKYDHFMDVMGAIEAHLSEKMSFDELFSTCRDNDFIATTKQYYLTEEIVLDKNELTKIRGLLKENCWYQYFKKHVTEIRTWIDFEQKIENALVLIFKFIKKLHINFEKYGKIDVAIRHLTKGNSDKKDEKFYLSEFDIDQLLVLGLFNVNDNYGIVTDTTYGSQPDLRHCFINTCWFYIKEKPKYGFSNEKYLSFLYAQLNNFIEIFDFYLTVLIAELKPNKPFIIKDKQWIKPEKIFSFNYTNTYQRIYEFINIEYLHGWQGEQQNIVLGISELEDEYLKKLKAFGFTKYHQKLFKDTDYLFLDKYKNQIRTQKEKILDCKNRRKGEIRNVEIKSLESELSELEKNNKLNLSFFIWGHSLDVSDRDYIIDLFSLNDDMDRNVRVTVFYFDKSAKFSLLNNLLAILGKELVEKWMKNKWLTFKDNPKIDFGI